MNGVEGLRALSSLLKLDTSGIVQEGPQSADHIFLSKALSSKPYFITSKWSDTHTNPRTRRSYV